MLRRSVKIQLIIFVIITLVGVSYVSADYVGLTKGLFGASGCTISADFAGSGGIFTNAEVTDRGVTVGRVGRLHLIDSGPDKGGVRVDLKLSDCGAHKYPVATTATVSDRSVIGEQYVNLIPPEKGHPPYLSAGMVIPMSQTSIPVSPETLLTNLDKLVKSVDVDHLQVVVDELGQAFNNEGPALGRLLDSADQLLDAADQKLPQTLALLKSADTVLTTQLGEGSALASFSHSLNLLSKQLSTSDPDVRSLLDDGPADLDVIRSFLQDNSTDLGVTLANLASTGQLLVRHRDGIEQVLELYPDLAAGAESVLRPTPGFGVVGALGLTLNNTTSPATCGAPNGGRQGYGSTQLRPPTDLSPQAPNVAVRCTAPVSSGTDVRGAANVPGGDPISESGGGVAYPRQSATGAVHVGQTSSDALLLGDQSWLAMLTDGLS